MNIRVVVLVAAALALSAAWSVGSAWSAATERYAIATALTGGDPFRAPALIRRYGCGGCHTISGIPGADGKVGPSLAELRERVYIGGVARNSPEDLVRWIQSPQTFVPHVAMPPTGISEREARDVAAFLYLQ